jgi:polyisoprenoid-binding protein YceI
MKKLFLFVFASFLSFAISAQSKAVNAAASKVNWKGYKVTGSHEGTINVKGGNLKFTGDVLTGGDFSIDMTSLNCTDLADKGKAGLEGHLKSDDFFGVAANPEAKFVISKVVSRGKAGDYKIIGNLTIKGITKEIKFDATVGAGMAKAAIKVDRTDFNVKYGSGSFIDNLGDKTIYDEFDLNVNLAF